MPALPSRVQPQPDRFYDGGALPRDGEPGVPPDPERGARVELARVGVNRFVLERRIAYRDRHLGEILVPARRGFRTDLTSTPTVFLWLVPRTGAHLPAALLHDGLVRSTGHDGVSYTSTEGRRIGRVEADRVFRDAMADTGTGVVRRWVAWAAVTLASFFVAGPAWPPVERWRHRLVAIGTLGLVVWLGWSATADLFDVSWPLAAGLPWMGERAFPVELAGGLAAAVVVPLLLSPVWGRLWVAGAIAGVALAVLLHVTVVIGLLTALYRAVDALARRWPLLALGLAAATVVTAVATVLWLSWA